MTPARRQRVREVILGAIALDADARERFVRDACAGDAAVLGEVERLLRHCDGPGDFLSAPAVDVAAALGLPRLEAAHGREDIPASIWGCEIVRVLGRGGMGVVYEAAQEQPRRRVAIKVLHRASAPDSPLPSFEAQVLARLTHPGIAHVYAAGEHRERGQRLPYVAMELVPEARSIVRYASEADLSIRARVELLLRLCEAVAHAHQRGIVHRDLKPGNVLVGPDGLPKVIDFGLARVTDPELTLTANLGDSVWGTVACMSPEQLSGRPDDVDARADIYALGVILYELLTDKPPFDLRGVPMAEAMRAVLRDEPPDPGSLDPRLRGNLSAITRKAMAKDRDKRYQWVGALAQDLRDHLAGRPVSARPPGPWQRFARWIGRHPVASTGAACAAVASLVIAATVLSVYVLARRPAEVDLHPDGRLARLKSVAGHALHVWQDGAPKGISATELTPRPAALGGGRVAVIARTEKSKHPDLAGHVAIYDISRPQTPIWTTRDAPLEPPAGYEDRIEIRTGLGPVLMADVFEESPGNEIVTVQGLLPYSPECIRVFDLSGRELYSVWHDGGLLSMVWLADRRQLVLAGYCSAHRWDERGLPWAAGAYPRIVLALSPRLGHAGRPWTLENDQPRDPTVVWCRWFGPAERLAALESCELAVTSRSRQGIGGLLLAEVGIPTRSEGTPTLVFGLNQSGDEIRRFTSDAYKAAVLAGALPDPDSFRLLDIAELPPVAARGDTVSEPGP